MLKDVVDLISRFPDPLVLAGLFLIASLLVKRLVFRKRRALQFACEVVLFVGFTAMLVVAGVSPVEPTPSIAGQPVRLIAVGAFKIGWWLTGAWLLVGFFRAVVFLERQPSETRFVQDLFAGIAYTSAVFAIIGNVFDMPISGLLAASGVIAIVLGLALQSTLGDVFSGIVLNVAKAYHPGDWVILDGGLQGRVLDVNWRATHVVTADNDLAIVPNSLIAKAKIVNVSSPTRAHGVSIIIRLEPSVVPSRGCSVLETALLSSNRILRTPAPVVTIRSLDGVALEIELQFFVPSIEQSAAAQNELFDLVFRHCASAGIRLAPPSNSPIPLPPRAGRQDPGDAPRRLLEHLPILAQLTDDERSALAPKLRRKSYKAGDVLVAPGTVTQALLILTSGALVAYEDRGGTEAEVVRLGPGDFFGEAGVLTGTPTPFKVTALTRAVVYEIPKDDLAPMLKEKPSIAAELSQALTRRSAVGKERLDRDGGSPDRTENLISRLTERVKDLFGPVG